MGKVGEDARLRICSMRRRCEAGISSPTKSRQGASTLSAASGRDFVNLVRSRGMIVSIGSGAGS